MWTSSPHLQIPGSFHSFLMLLCTHTYKKKKKAFFITDVHSISRASDLMEEKKKKEDKETKNACRAPNCCRWGTREGDPLAMRL